MLLAGMFHVKHRDKLCYNMGAAPVAGLLRGRAKAWYFTVNLNRLPLFLISGEREESLFSPALHPKDYAR